MPVDVATAPSHTCLGLGWSEPVSKQCFVAAISITGTSVFWCFCLATCPIVSHPNSFSGLCPVFSKSFCLAHALRSFKLWWLLGSLWELSVFYAHFWLTPCFSLKITHWWSQVCLARLFHLNIRAVLSGWPCGFHLGFYLLAWKAALYSCFARQGTLAASDHSGRFSGTAGMSVTRHYELCAHFSHFISMHLSCSASTSWRWFSMWTTSVCLRSPPVCWSI